MLMEPAALDQLVLRDRRIRIYACGRGDIASRQIDRRVLATLELLADTGLRPTVSALKCAQSGAAYAAGDAVDITAVNRTSVRGHQGPNSLTATAIRRLLTLQGALKPSRIVSLITFPDADNTVARSDHAARVEVDFSPLFGDNAGLAARAGAILQPGGLGGGLGGLGAFGGPTPLSSPGGPAPSVGGSVQAPTGAPVAVARAIAAGDAIATLPYVWGGGHASFQDTGYDCSGSVSYALAAAGLLQAPLVSGQFESWGQPGPGRWITIYANGGHVFMTIAGWRFDTVALAETGTRWSRAPASSAGFVIRHPPGL
jgi:cell wall-associated NlpC family hydrolase